MPSLIDIRRRIRSVKNTQQITKAMKMVSAAKLRRAQDRALAARPYANILQQMLANVAEADSGDRDYGRWRAGWWVQREPDSARAEVCRRALGDGIDVRADREEGARL